MCYESGVFYDIGDKSSASVWQCGISWCVLTDYGKELR